MNFFKRVLTVTATAVPLLVQYGCFPTGSDDPIVNNPLTPDTLVTTNDDPTDLPTDINTSANTTDAGIDSMFNLLIERSEALGDIETKEELYALDFASLRGGFGAAVATSPNHVKANVGFIVSSVLSVNAHPELQKMIDSIDGYINTMDAYYSEPMEPYLVKKAVAKKTAVPATGFLSKTFAAHGVVSAGQVLFAQAPNIVLAQSGRPSFPRFLTMSYIQNMVESAVIPRLNEVIAATQRLRAQNQMSLLLTVDGETAEIDAGDIYIVEGMVRAARAGFTMMCIYDYDLYSPDGSKDMRWIDSYVDAIDKTDYYSRVTYSLVADTLLKDYYQDVVSMTAPIMEMYQYNLGRPEFLRMRKNYCEAAYSDLKMVPVLLKAGVVAIKNEVDNQDDDLFPSSDILEMSTEMGELSQDMLEEGFSTALATKFQSPESLMDFISFTLSNPYTFDETIDGRHIKVTVDLSKYFTNQVASLREYWPKHKIPTGDARYVTYTWNSFVDDWPSDRFYVYSDDYDSVQVALPASKIKSITPPTWEGGSTLYTLNDSYQVSKTVHSFRIAIPLQLIDDKGNPIDYFKLLGSEVTPQALPTLFPYFDDYTLKGIFPEMTSRQNWIDLFSVFLE